MFKSILVATDGSIHADNAVKIGCDLAAKYQAKLAFIHVLGNGPLPTGFEHWVEVEHLAHRTPSSSAPHVEDLTANLSVAESIGEAEGYQFRLREIAGEQVIKRAKETAKDNGIKNAKEFIDTGNPADRIAARAHAEGADIIVMGTRGLSEIKGLLMGSISHKVIQISDCVCMTVK